jgi:phosphatidate cytidylyltransferase
VTSPADESAASPGSEPASRNLLTRVLAALVLVPVAVVIVYWGGWPWAVLVTAAAVGLYLEWIIIVGARRQSIAIACGVAALAVAGFAIATQRPVVALGAVAAGLAAALAGGGAQRLWAAAGFLYAALALLASVALRLDPQQGFAALIFVLLVVWVTDIGGYFAGRGLGGPKLWPRVSPRKTWAGAIGGLAGSLLVAAVAAAARLGPLATLLLLAALLSVVSQLGDLFESAVKRRFGVKDSSQIIPGHGGLLDRLDGFVAAICLAALIGFLRGGLTGAGRAFLVW